MAVQLVGWPMQPWLDARGGLWSPSAALKHSERQVTASAAVGGCLHNVYTCTCMLAAAVPGHWDCR